MALLQAMLELGGWQVAQSGVQAFLVVDLLDEALDGSASFPYIPIFLPIHFLTFQGFHPGLAAAILPRTSLVAHADLAAVGLQQLGIGGRGILAAAIGMMHPSWRGTPLLQCH